MLEPKLGGEALNQKLVQSRFHHCHKIYYSSEFQLSSYIRFGSRFKKKSKNFKILKVPRISNLSYVTIIKFAFWIIFWTRKRRKLKFETIIDGMIKMAPFSGHFLIWSFPTEFGVNPQSTKLTLISVHDCGWTKNGTLLKLSVIVDNRKM